MIQASGGLSLLHEAQKLLPNADITYVADTANTPYGTKTETEILGLVERLVEELEQRGTKLAVIACNSATVLVVGELRRRKPELELIGIVPPLQTAASWTKSKTVAVFATPVTVASDYYAELKSTYGSAVRFLDYPCPDWVAMVEAGDVDEGAVNARIGESVSAGADTAVLSCTHFSFLKPIFAQHKKLITIEPQPAVARHFHDVAVRRGWAGKDGGSVRYLATGDTERISRIATRLQGEPVSFEPF